MKAIDSKYFSDSIKSAISKIPTFDPSHPLKLLWDMLTMMSISYFLIFFPLRVAFGLEIYFSFIPYIAFGVLLADSVIYLNTGFYERGVLVSDRIGIFMHYISHRMLADIFSLMPFFVYDFSDINENLFSNMPKLLESLIGILFLIRLKHLGMSKKKIEERFYEKKTLMHIISLLSLLLTTIYIAHLLACFWAITA
jgi:hypothetical protein